MYLSPKDIKAAAASFAHHLGWVCVSLVVNHDTRAGCVHSEATILVLLGPGYSGSHSVAVLYLCIANVYLDGAG